MEVLLIIVQLYFIMAIELIFYVPSFSGLSILDLQFYMDVCVYNKIIYKKNYNINYIHIIYIAIMIRIMRVWKM